MTPDALIFDLDGTLWDAATACADGWNIALEELGVKSRVTVDGIRSVSGRPFPECVAGLLPGICPLDEATLEFIDEHERLGIETGGVELYEGVAEGIRELAARYPLFVVSNCPAWYLEVFLRTSGLRGCFTGWDCHGASGLGKAEMLRILAGHHGLRRAVYVGDTQSDLEAATAAGMEFAFAGWGFGTIMEPAPRSFAGFSELVDEFLG